MSDTAQSMRDDIAFVRALAEEGRDGPLLGGSILFATGLIYAGASVADWLAVTRLPAAAATPWMAGIWGGALVVQALMVATMTYRLRRRVGLIGRSNRVFAMVWNGVGLAIVACLASFLLTARLDHIEGVFAGFPAVVLAIYGVGWTVTATASRQRWMWVVALLCYAFAIAVGGFVGSRTLLLVFALALLLLLAAPGAILLKQAQAKS
jgi:hypothetical protein